jgi:glutamate-ammonia-ligase adenylyltransferase
MALTRARVVAGPVALRKRVEAAIRAGIMAAGAAEAIRADAAAMRSRLARELPARQAWDAKHRDGGQMEVEFIAQALQLVAAPHHPSVLSPTTRQALERLHAAGVLSSDDAALLIRADLVWRTVIGMLRLTDGPVPRQTLSPAAAEALLAATWAVGVDAVDVAHLRGRLNELAAAVRAAFVRLIGEVAG